MIERLFIQKGLKKIKLEEYFRSELKRAGFVGVDVVKTPVATRIIINVTRPGLAIGKKGKTIRTLTKELEEVYGFENPQIEVQEVKHPELDAKACVDRIVALIERGYSWRSVVYRVMEDAIASGAQGIEILLKGVLAGKGNRKKKERVAKGYMKKAGEQAYLVDYAKGVAVPKQGAIGVKVRIIKPDVVFPDKRNIKELLGKKAKPEEKGTGEEAGGSKEKKTEEKVEERVQASEESAEEKKETKEEKVKAKEKGKEDKKESKKQEEKHKERKQRESPTKTEKEESEQKQEKACKKKGEEK
ncbi:MAG: 30S ribosomal protein S3 [Candidatus Diapherotrites archaeon]|nr:30S ribosomal protein S3 [Candidatus Diapherotrites archaeon]